MLSGVRNEWESKATGSLGIRYVKLHFEADTSQPYYEKQAAPKEFKIRMSRCGEEFGGLRMRIATGSSFVNGSSSGINNSVSAPYASYKPVLSSPLFYD